MNPELAAKAGWVPNFRDISRDQAVKELKFAEAGVFIIRPSSRPKCISMSFKDHVTGTVQHMLLQYTSRGWAKENDGKYFPDVITLLRAWTELQLKIPELVPRPMMGGMPIGGGLPFGGPRPDIQRTYGGVADVVPSGGPMLAGGEYAPCDSKLPMPGGQSSGEIYTAPGVSLRLNEDSEQVYAPADRNAPMEDDEQLYAPLQISKPGMPSGFGLEESDDTYAPLQVSYPPPAGHGGDDFEGETYVALPEGHPSYVNRPASNFSSGGLPNPGPVYPGESFGPGGSNTPGGQFFSEIEKQEEASDFSNTPNFPAPTSDAPVMPTKPLNFQQVTREEAEEMLSNEPPGAYLLRSSSRPQCVSLSFKEHGSNLIQHFLCVKTEQGWLKEENGEVYDSLLDLLLAAKV